MFDKTVVPSVMRRASKFVSFGKLSVPTAVKNDSLATIEKWQHHAYVNDSSIPEIGFSHTMLSNLFARGSLRVLKSEPSLRGAANYVPTDDVMAVGVLKQFHEGTVAYTENMRRVAYNMLVTGDGYIVGVPKGVGSWDWEFLSIFELRKETAFKNKDQYYKFDPDKPGDKTYYPVNVYIKRVHRPDAQFSLRASSAMKHNRDLCDQIIFLDKLINSVTKSGINAGVWAIADELDLNDSDDETLQPDGSDAGSLTKFEQAYFDMTQTIDADSSNAGTPMLVRGPKEFLPNKDSYVTFARPFDENLSTLREAALTRIFRGLDIPIENIVGKGDVASWSTYAIEQDTITKHIQPLGNLVASIFTNCVLRPMLITSGVDPREAALYVFLYDSSQIATKPDMTKTAIELFNMFELSGEALRRYAGVEESDKPSDEELVLRLKRQSSVKGVSANVGSVKDSVPEGNNARPRKRANNPVPDTSSPADESGVA